MERDTFFNVSPLIPVKVNKITFYSSRSEGVPASRISIHKNCKEVMPSLKFRQAIHAFTEVSAGKQGMHFAPEIWKSSFLKHFIYITSFPKASSLLGVYYI